MDTVYASRRKPVYNFWSQAYDTYYFLANLVHCWVCLDQFLREALMARMRYNV